MCGRRECCGIVAVYECNHRSNKHLEMKSSLGLHVPKEAVTRNRAAAVYRDAISVWSLYRRRVNQA